MWSYLARRLLMSLLVLFGVSVLTFSMLHLVPGDPVHAILGRQAVSAETINNLRAELGLNDPLPVQYGRFLERAFHGDLGRSIRSKRPVTDVIFEQLPSTIKLTLSAMAVAILIGLPLGIIAALNQNRWVDTLIMMAAISGVSIPSFWLGLILILVFTIGLGWMPSVASSSDWRSLVLPALTLGLAEAAVLTRLVRASMLDVLSQQYLKAARAKGVPERSVITRHAFRNALIPIVTMLGLQFVYLLAGSVVVESIFARQGIGRVAVAAIENRDFPLAQGVVLIVATIYVVINTLTDLSYAFLDPRIRLK